MKRRFELLLCFVLTFVTFSTSFQQHVTSRNKCFGRTYVALSESTPTGDAGVFRLPNDAPKKGNTEPFVEIDVDQIDFTDENLKNRVLTQMELAFDNYQIPEIRDMFKRLWLTRMNEPRINDACLQLIKLTKDAEEIENEAIRRDNLSGSTFYNMEDLYDAVRVVRSRIRMYGKDAEFCSSDGLYKPYEFKWPWENINN